MIWKIWYRLCMYVVHMIWKIWYQICLYIVLTIRRIWYQIRLYATHTIWRIWCVNGDERRRTNVNGRKGLDGWNRMDGHWMEWQGTLMDVGRNNNGHWMEWNEMTTMLKTTLQSNLRSWALQRWRAEEKKNIFFFYFVLFYFFLFFFFF